MKTTCNLVASVLIAFFTLSMVSAQEINNKVQNTVQSISINNFSGSLKIQDGFWTATKEKGMVYIQITNSRKSKDSFFMSFSVKEDELKQHTNTSFELNRASGTMIFNGQFPQNESTGKFTFTHNKDFENFLKGKVMTNASKNKEYYLFKLFLGNVTKSYVNGILQKGYTPTIKQLGKLAIHRVTLGYIDALEKTNYHSLELDMLIKFAMHKISIAYINELNKAGYGHIDAQMLKRFATHRITKKYIEELTAVGYENLEANMLKNFATHKIGSTYIKSLLATNIDKPNANDIKKAKVHRVSATFIKYAQDQGHSSRELSDYIRLKVRGI